jgi:hypothetical protein
MAYALAAPATVSTPAPAHRPLSPPLNAAQEAELERRLEALGERLDLADGPPCPGCGRDWPGLWGDVCAALLPESYGEPSALPEAPCDALPGSKRRIAAMAARHGGAGLLVGLARLYHPADRTGREPGDLEPTDRRTMGDHVPDRTEERDPPWMKRALARRRMLRAAGRVPMVRCVLALDGVQRRAAAPRRRKPSPKPSRQPSPKASRRRHDPAQRWLWGPDGRCENGVYLEAKA